MDTGEIRFSSEEIHTIDQRNLVASEDQVDAHSLSASGHGQQPPQLEPQALDKSKIRFGYVFWLSITFSIGMFQFGYCLQSVNSMYFIFNQKFCLDLQDANKDFTLYLTSSCILGGTISATTCSYLFQFGKWKIMHFSNLLCIVGCIITIFPQNSLNYSDFFYQFIIGRFIQGFACGINTVLVPKYINETVPFEIKGQMGAISQLMVTFGIFIASLFGLAVFRLPETDDNLDCEEARDLAGNNFWLQNYWQVCWSVPIFLAVFQSFMLIVVFKFDTPFYLKKTLNYDNLLKVMNKIYAGDEVTARINDIEVRDTIGLDFQQKVHHATWTETFFDKTIRKRAWAGCFMSVIQQLTGINMFIFYSNQLLASVGTTTDDNVILPVSQQPIIRYSVDTTIIMAVNFVTSIGAIYLLKIMGRKTLLAGNLLIMACSCALMLVITNQDAQVFQLIVICIFIACFEFGPGPICWIYMAEITNDKAMAVGTAINWILTLLMSILTPVLLNNLPQGLCYAIFVAPCFLFFIFAIGIMHETKGLSEVEVLALYRPDADLILERAKITEQAVSERSGLTMTQNSSIRGSSMLSWNRVSQASQYQEVEPR